MSVDRSGFYVWEEDLIYDGIRQDASESIRRYRRLENMHWGIRGALTKDKGTKLLTTTAINSGSYPTAIGFDAHFSNGTQYLVVVNGTSTPDQKPYIYNTSTNVFDEQAQGLHATNRPCLFMFANKLMFFDGTEVKAMAHDKSFTTPGDSLADACRFGGVYANRAVVAGSATYPHTFFPSGVMDETSWGAANSVDVTGTFGQEITAMGNCGRFWIVTTRSLTRAYYLGTAGPKDWDFDDVSNLSGAIGWESFVQPSGIKGVNTNAFAFFWGDDGPMMVVDTGSGVPRLIPLWNPIQSAVRGQAWQDVIALDPTGYDSVVGEFVPQAREIRFSCRETNETKNNVLWCLDYDSAVRYAMSGENDEFYPFWRIRKNEERGWLPCHHIFLARLGSGGEPASNGQMRMMGCRDGYVYEYDAPDIFTDADPSGNDVSFSWKIRKDGYDGVEDGSRVYTKSNRHIQVRSTSVSGIIYATLYTDGGALSSTTEIDPSTYLSYWGTDSVTGSWGDGGVWNAGEFVPIRGEVVGKGKKFDLELTDNGSIEEEFSINSFSLMGYVEDEI